MRRHLYIESLTMSSVAEIIVCIIDLTTRALGEPCHRQTVGSINRRFWYMHMIPTYKHYSDVIMGEIASQITSLTIVYSTVYSDADQRKHQSSASLAFVRGIHRGPVNGQLRGDCFHLMTSSWIAETVTLSRLIANGWTFAVIYVN